MKRYLFLVSLAAFFGCTNMTPEKDYSGYQPAEGKVSYVYAARVSKHGFRGAAYRVTYTPPGAEKPMTVDGKLNLRKYEKGDVVQIFYNPSNPADEVTDAK